MFRKIFVTLLCCIFSIHISQIPGLRNYNENDGLNSSYTYRLKQDNNGFIWIGSDNGLFRFDGKEFKQYGKEEGLMNIEVIDCEPLPNGEVFLIPYLNDFAYLKNGKIINLSFSRLLKNQLANSLAKTDRNGNTLYLYSTNNPKSILTYENGTVKTQTVRFNYDKKDVDAFKYDFRRNILYMRNYKEDRVLAYTMNDNKIKIIQAEGDFVCEKDNLFVFNHKGTINVYKKQGLFKFLKINSYRLKQNIIYGSIDKNNKLWLNLEAGGALYFNQSLLDEKKPLDTPVKFLQNYTIHNVLVDKDDNVWFNSKNNGIFFITKVFFDHYINLSLKNNSGYIKAIATDGKSIFLGYNNSSVAIYSNNNLKNIVFDEYYKHDSKAIYCQGSIRVFAFTNKIVVYNTEQSKKSILYYNAKNIIPYSKDSILFCTSQGLLMYHLQNGKIEILSDERTYTALPLTEDSILMGNFNDLYKLNIKTKKRELFLEGCYLNDVKKLKENLYIGASNTNGIILFNNKQIVRKITKKEGLISNQVKKINIETPDVFWASTNSGISRIEMKENNIRINNFTQLDGLPSNLTAGCIVRNDSVFIATSGGLAIFPITKLLAQEKSINKKVIINSVKIGSKEYSNISQKLQGITPDDVIFDLSFPDYTSQGKIAFKYKVEGLNNIWQTTNSSKIILNSIPPGKYLLKVIGLGYNGKQSYASTDLAFEIRPRFWQTWWFTSAMTFILLTVIYVLINSYFQKRRKKKLEALYFEKKIAELELQAIKAQINPHFIYNCLNSIQYLLFKGDYSKTENYLNIFSKMIRKTLHYSEKTFITINEEADYLFLYLNMEKLRQDDLFDYSIDISEDVNKNWAIPSLLIQPFVENAIKHGVSDLENQKGLISISFDYKNESLCITIEDNGTGISNIKESALNNSFGLKLSQKRIETFKHLFETNITLKIVNLSDESEKQGTQVKLYITPNENQNTNLHH